MKGTTSPEVVSAAQWQAARDRLRLTEKAATHALDALAAETRRLPMVQFRAGYRFTTPHGEATLPDLFDGQRQLVVYHFMDNGPDDYCPGCTAYTDNTDTVAGRGYLHERQTSYATVSDMPLPQIQRYSARRGWSVPFSSHGSTFNPIAALVDDSGSAHSPATTTSSGPISPPGRGPTAFRPEHLRPDRARTPG